MISYIKGFVTRIDLDSIVVENNGIGFHIFFSQQHKVNLDQEVTIYTYLNVREDEMALFGFFTVDDLNLFTKLISVRGIGPRMALNIFIKSDSHRIITAIEDGSVDYLKTLPGIGPKTASQMILDLKGKLIEVSTNKKGHSNEILEALSGLKSLGYKQSELNKIENQLIKEADNKSVSEIIKIALTLLQKRKGG